MKKKPNCQSFQKTLAFAATVTALGASLGVPSLALGIQPIEAPATEQGAQASGPNAGVVQEKWKKSRKAGANQMKERTGGAGANQKKLDKTKAKALGGAGSNNMLNPQPLPPKQQNLPGE
jgi:hypothetical protein